MAPESERAKRADVPFCKHCGFKLGDHHNDVCQYWGQVLPSECIYIAALDNHSSPPAPATCSEVVERLATECVGLAYDYSLGDNVADFDRELATAILHSWRERRVQELEEALRPFAKFVDEIERDESDDMHATFFHVRFGDVRKAAKVLQFGVARADQEGREA